MSELRCPRCGKVFDSPSHENREMRVSKIRIVMYSSRGGAVKGKCRHCGSLFNIPNLRAVQS